MGMMKLKKRHSIPHLIWNRLRGTGDIVFRLFCLCIRRKKLRFGPQDGASVELGQYFFVEKIIKTWDDVEAVSSINPPC